MYPRSWPYSASKRISLSVMIADPHTRLSNDVVTLPLLCMSAQYSLPASRDPRPSGVASPCVYAN